jgi:hypothetical protein
MSAWFTAVAPFLPDIIQMAKPIFTRSKGADAERRPDLVPKQIAELQDAAAQNSDAIHKLAEEMQQTIAALRQGSAELQERLDSARRNSLIAMTVAVLSFALAAVALAL